MSDCSTSAMEPKYVVNNEALQGFADRIAVLVGMDDMADCPCNLVDIYHATKSKINELEAAEERYERLAQVAREMYRVIAMFEARFEAEHYSPSEWAPERGAITKSTKEQLEALGVSVDDQLRAHYQVAFAPGVLRRQRRALVQGGPLPQMSYPHGRQRRLHEMPED